MKRKRGILFSARSKPFNDDSLYSIFFDKQKTYNVLAPYTIPTVTVKNSDKVTVDKAIEMLTGLIDRHASREDFAPRFVLKDRFGAGGDNIFIVDNNLQQIQSILQRHPDVSFILQPFLMFCRGY